MTRPVVFADFNNSIGKGTVRLTSAGTLDDLERWGLTLHEGMQLTLSDGELQVEAMVRFDHDEQRWVADFEWNALSPSVGSG